MLTWKRCLLALAGLVILLLLFIITILPGIIKGKASAWVASETGRTLTTESISINPLSLSIEIRGLQLSDRGSSETFVAWDRLRLSLSAASAFRRAPIIDEFTLDNPAISLKRLDEKTFNFSDLVPAGDDSSKEESATEPLGFSVNNIAINNGSINLIDESLDDQVQHTIEELHLVLPSISNLPYMVENPAQPMLSAIINDAPFEIKGQIKPFTDIQEMNFDLKLDNIDLPHYLGYVPTELPVDLRNGKLNLDLDILYRVSPQAGGELELSGKIDLVSVNIWDRLQEQLFFLPLLQLDIAPSQPLQQDIHLSSLRVYNLEVQLNRDKQGTWNHSRMAAAGDKAPEAAEDETNTAPFRLKIDDIEIRDGVVVFEDKLPDGGFKTVAREINIDISDFALEGTSNIPINLTLETEREENVSVNGHFLLAPLTLNLRTQLLNLDVAAYDPYYADVYSVPLGGKIDALINVSVDQDNPLLVSDSALTWRDAYMAFNENEGLGVELLEMQGLAFDLAKNRLEIDAYRGSNGKVNFSRNPEGHWSILSANFPILEKLAEAPETGASPESKPEVSEGPEFSYRIDELAFNNWQFDIKDHLPATPVTLQASNFNLAFKNLAAPEAVQSSVDFKTDFGRRGKISLQGALSLAKQTMEAKGQIKRVALATFAPYVAEETNLVLSNGFLNADIGAKLVGTDQLELRFGGRVGISRMHLLDGTHREDLLKWDSLQVAGISGNLSPLSLVIDSVTLSDYFAKVLIDEEARINLIDAFSKEAAASESAVEEPSPEAVNEPKPTAESPAEDLPDIRIGKVILQGGQVDFTDRNLPRPFHADMTELGGRVDGLSSHPGTQATVDLRGSLRNQSPLSISGQLNPLAEDLFLDIELSFRDIEMTPFSPYSGNYVGYLIEKGKLNLSLDYLIEENELKATNKVFIDQFDFGAAVESENATSLPVKLAIALLKDGNGEIHLDIPVYGSLDDPQFSIGSVIWTVVKNLLVKAATSPFALLGAILGGGGDEDFSSVGFDYGSARLAPAEQDKLQRMSQALIDRPSLDVEISGFIDPDKDPEGYRRESLLAKIKRLKYLDLLDAGDLPEGLIEEEVEVPADEYADYLWDVYKDEDFPKPRNFIGMTKKLPESEMEKLIYANTEVDESQLAELAQARALAVQNFLTEQGELPRERTFLKKPDILESPDEETDNRARVELGATVK